MCGRYALAQDPSALAVEFDAEPTEQLLEPDYNIAPTKQAVIVVDRSIESADGSSVRARSLEIARWGLIPSWAKDPAIASRLINARSETVAQKPSFRAAFAKRRCLVPADGYYEWYVPEAGYAGKVRKQPFYIRPADTSTLAMAGMYEWWRDRSLADDAPDAWRLTFCVITTEASPEVSRIHDRMPVAVAREDWSAWLNPLTPADDVHRLLAPVRRTPLESWPVPVLVSNVRNNGPALIEPIAEAGP